MSWRLGDMVSQALEKVGITKDRVSKLLGKECGCADRQDKLNRLGLWARRVLTGRTDNAEEYLNRILTDE